MKGQSEVNCGFFSLACLYVCMFIVCMFIMGLVPIEGGKLNTIIMEAASVRF